MKKMRRILPLLIIVAAVFSLCAIPLFAEIQQNGWSLDSDGVERYYENGSYVTGMKVIDGFPYYFASNGKYLGAYDGHDPIGDADTANTSGYRDALAAAKCDIYGYYSFDAGELYGSASYVESNLIANDATFGSADVEQTFVYLYNKAEGIGSSTNANKLQLACRNTAFERVDRISGGKAIKVVSSASVSSHSYVNVWANAPAGAELVIEGEFMLGEGYASSNTLLQLIDRNNADTKANYMPGLVNISANGGVYLSNDNSSLVCVLTEREYTRISVAVHPKSNTIDVYVNGVNVVKGAVFIKDSQYDAEKFNVDELRLAQFNTADTGSMYIDNIAIYGASAPVNTSASSAARNGVYLEGGVLRYYQNDRIALGTKAVSGTFLGKTFDNELINFGTAAGNGSYALGYEATVLIDGKVNSKGVIAGNMFFAPEAVTLSSGAFGGWRVTTAGGTEKVLAPGESYPMSGDIVCEAIALDFAMLDGASIKTVEGSSSLRFMGKVSRGQYELLKSSGVEIELHMLLAPKYKFDATHGYYTLEAFEKAGYTDITDITISQWYTENDGYYYYTGAVDGISADKLTEEYSAVAYLKLKFSNGTEYTVYTDHDVEENSRSVYDVAYAAYNDRTTLKGQNNYGNKIKYGKLKTYSPYDQTRLNVIKSFADAVVALSVSNEGVKPAGDFYDAPYTVKTEYNNTTLKTDVTVSLKGSNTVSDVRVNGESLDSGSYTVSGNVYNLSVDIGETQLSDFGMGADKVKSWTLVYCDQLFGNYTEEVTHEGVGTSEWAYSGSGASLVPKQDVGIGDKFAYEENGKYYFDISSAKAFTFYVYCNNDAQTAQLCFNSENPQTDGSDYYGFSLKLNKGWNYFSLSMENASATRTPLGWDKITSIGLSQTGWNQNNDSTTVVYFTDFTAYNTSNIADAISSPAISQAAVFALGGYYSAVNGVKYSNSNDVNATAFEKNGVYYVPMSSLAAEKGSEAKYYSSSSTLVFKYDGKSYVFNAGSKTYTVNGAKATLTVAPQTNGDALFFGVDDVMSIFGYTQKYIDRMGLIVLSDTENIFDEDRDYDTIYELISVLIYVRPSGDKIVSDLNANSGGKHPYLMIDGDGFEELRYYAGMDSTLQGYIAKLERQYGVGSGNFNAEVNHYELTDGQRLLSISRDVMGKTIPWALLSKLYEVSDPELSATYAERCWKELEAVCNFHDGTYYSWHPAHFLDTGELAYPMAICYDWLYDYWTATNSNVDSEKYGYTGETTRLSLMEDSMYWMGLAASSYVESDTTGKYIPYGFNLAGSTNNWNGVCNGGLMAAALAICNVDRYAESVENFLGKCITAVEKGMWVYAPEGGYEEGPGYWSYGTTYLQVFISCLDSACGTNYGVYNAPGFERSVYFTTYLGTKNTTWGFHDGGSGSADTSIAAWFARKSNDPNVNAIRRQAIENGWKGSSFYDIMYFDPHIMSANITLTLDAYYSLDTIMTFRSSWDADTCLFAGLHGGDNQASHGDLDIGNFVISANGSFIICDLGSDSYNMPGYFGSYRWSYYRKRAEGQNTLVMIPSSENKDGKGWDGKTGTPALKPGSEASNTEAGTNLPTTDQILDAVSECIRYESGTNSALGVVDMAPAFANMTSGKRGMLMTNNRSTIIVQDEAVFDQDMDIWWFAHTQGEITLIDGGRAAVISYNGTYLYAEIVTDMEASAKFTVMEAVSLDNKYTGWTVSSGYYTGDTEGNRSSYSKLCVNVDDASELRLAVAFTVINSLDELPEFGTTYTWTDIDAWKVD